MYPITLLIVAAISMFVIGGLELSLVYAKQQGTRLTSRVLNSFATTAEADVSSKLATVVQNGTPLTQQTAPITSATPIALCFSGTSTQGCTLQGSYVTTITAIAEQGGSGSETSPNVNVNGDEHRFLANLALTIANSHGVTIASQTRTVTVRTYPVPPYATIIDAVASSSALSNGIVGGNGARENDLAGCNDTNSCGAITTIDSNAACNYVPDVPNISQSAVSTLENGWCAAKAGQAPTSSIGSQTLVPVSTTQLQQETYSAPQ